MSRVQLTIPGDPESVYTGEIIRMRPMSTNIRELFIALEPTGLAIVFAGRITGRVSLIKLEAPDRTHITTPGKMGPECQLVELG